VQIPSGLVVEDASLTPAPDSSCTVSISEKVTMLRWTNSPGGEKGNCGLESVGVIVKHAPLFITALVNNRVVQVINGNKCFRVVRCW
jgi:hypothetical protein